MYVCVFLNLYITAQPGLDVLIFQSYRYGSTLWGSVYMCGFFVNLQASAQSGEQVVTNADANGHQLPFLDLRFRSCCSTTRLHGTCVKFEESR